MNLLNLKNNIYKKILCLIPLSLLYFPPSHAELKIEFEDSDSLVETILQEASNTMGIRVGAKQVNWSWCKDDYSYYDPFRNIICLRKSLKNQDLAMQKRLCRYWHGIFFYHLLNMYFHGVGLQIQNHQ